MKDNHSEVPEDGYKIAPTDNNPKQGVAEDNLGDEFVKEGNQAVVQNSLEELDRVEITKMDADALKAYAEVVTSFGYLKDNLEEPERRPNAQLFGVTD